MEYGVALNETERSTSKSISNHQKFHFVYQNQQMNSLHLDDNMKTSTDASVEELPMPDETVSFQTNDKSLQCPTSSRNDLKKTIQLVGIKNIASSDAVVAESTITNNTAIMEISATTHINLIDDDEEEKDPLALDSSSEQSQLQENRIVKHTHSLRRHVPRIIVKPLPPEKKTTNSTSATLTTTTMINSITSPSSLSSISPSSRGSSSRRIQQQQQAKAAAAAAAAAANASSSGSATTLLTTAVTQASTMREVLASIPGFSLKPRRRSSKKISTAAQIEQTKDGKIDLETPDSILASTNLRALLNKQTFSMLPPLYQYNLIQLLPSVDREAIEMERKHGSLSTLPMEAIRLGSSSLNNEFFARACLEWRERLSEGEFTPENQIKLKSEADRERNKLDPWKIKHFEPIWGEKVANRACCSSSSNSSITINSIDGYNNAINSNNANFKNIGEKLDLKLESKGPFSATTVAEATSASSLNSNEKNDVKVEKQDVKSIIECRLDQTQTHSNDAIGIKEEKEFSETSNDRNEKAQHLCNANEDVVDNNNAHLQIRIQDELKCDKQTETYIKIEANEQNYTVNNNTNDLDVAAKSETPSVFDLLRKQGNEYEHCNQQQKRGTKRGCSSDVFLTSGESGFENDNFHNQTILVGDEATGNFVERNKVMKIETAKENVPKRNQSCFVSCTMDLTKPIFHQQLLTSSSAATTTTTATATATTPSEIIQITQMIGGDPSNSISSASSQNLTFTQDFLKNFNAAELKTQMQILQKQQQQNMCTSSQLKPISSPAATQSTTTTTKLQYFVNTNQNLINIKSTCDSTKDAFIETTPTTINITTKSIINSTTQQNDDVINPVPLCEGVVVEQNFADAENYVLHSGDISTDSGDTINVQDATTNTAVTTNKNSPNEAVISDDFENIYESNKSILATSISSITTSSSSSSSSSSTSSSPATSSAVTTTDMQEIFSAGNSLSNTLFHAPQQQRPQPRQQQQQDQHHQQQTLQQQSVLHRQQSSHGCNLTNNSGSSNSTSSNGSTVSNSSRHNELFQHVQHDWNFGGLKLQQSIENNLNETQLNQTINERQQQQMILQPTNVHEEHEVSDQNIEEIEGCASISTQATGHDLVGRQIVINEAVVADVDADAEDDEDDEDDVEDDDDDDDVDDDDGDVDDDEDEMDDSDAVRDIVDELQQQHQQMLNEQRQQQEQLQQLHASDQRQNLQQSFAAEHLEYSNEMSESLSSEVLCDVPISAAEMEVTSTVATNNNSNDENSNELSLFSGAANISNTGINHLQQLPSQSTQVQQQQQQQHQLQPQQHRQILIDSNGQLIRNFLVQQQQLQQQQQQLLQHAQLAAFQQTGQHHQPAVTAMPQSTATLQQQPTQQPHPQAQTQLLHSQQHKTPTLSMQVIHRRPFESSTNGQAQIFQHNIATAAGASNHPQQIEPSNQQQHQQQQRQLHFALQQQQRNFFAPNPNTAPHSSTNNNFMPSQHTLQLHAQQQQQQQHHTHHQQQVPTFQTQVHQQTPSPHQPPKFLPKQLNIISMPRSTINITSTPGAVAPSPAPAYTYSTPPAIGSPLHAAASAASAATNQLTSNILAHQQHHQPTPPPPPQQQQPQQQQLRISSNSTPKIRTLPSTPAVGGIPTTIAQHRLMMTKMPSGKGRKTVNNKLPPGAVNLERSYQICQAVIQNSPNRESLKAQLRPPPAILGQQQQQHQHSSGGSSPSSTSLSNSCSSASSSPSSSGMMIKNEDIIAPSTTLPASTPPNVMGVGRPNVYKVIGPRMGFPRKKYVQRQPSPTMIRHVYAAPTGAVALPTSAQQLSVMQQQHHHSHLHAPPPQREIHQNGSGQYVLVHRANVGAADNQAPRASSAPPVAQNQHQFRGMNGIPITGRGRPASVDVDTSNTVHDIHQPIHGANAANIVRRNISAGNITYIDNYSATPTAALIDGNNYIAAAAAAAAAANNATVATNTIQSADAGSETTSLKVDGNNCACSLNAMVICQQCGAFCHDDCVSATRLCVSCVIR